MGVDPGKNGAVCVLGYDGSIVDIYRMPETLGDLHDICESWEPHTVCHDFDTVAVIEKVGAFKGNSPQSMFNFGRNYGQLEGTFFANNIPLSEVTPQKWQQHYQLGKSSDFESKTAWKSHLWATAQKLYPSVDIKKYAADAVLIARYCWERFKV